MAPCDGLFHLRRAVEDDATSIARVHVESWREAYAGLMPADYLAGLSTERRARFWSEEIRVLPPARRPWVAENNDELVGFAHSGPARDDDAPPNAGEIYLIYVARECRSRGLGRDLLMHGERDLKSGGYDVGLLWVLADNESARRFYENHGWRPDGEVKPRNFGGRDLDEIRYRKPLDTSFLGAGRSAPPR